MINTPITQVPNYLFDQFLPILSEAELKVYLVILRQTVGWVITGTKKRKQRDRITNAQFQKKTGLSKRCISNTIQRLLLRKLIEVTSFCGKSLFFPKDRRGKSYLYFSIIPPFLVKQES